MRVGLVGLDTIRQSNCNELRIVSIRSNFRDCGLREKTGDKRVYATAYPKNESSAGSLAQITPQEIDPAPNLKRRIEIGSDPEVSEILTAGLGPFAIRSLFYRYLPR